MYGLRGKPTLLVELPLVAKLAFKKEQLIGTKIGISLKMKDSHLLKISHLMCKMLWLLQDKSPCQFKTMNPCSSMKELLMSQARLHLTVITIQMLLGILLLQTIRKDLDQESIHGNTLFGSSDNWGLNPIRTEIPKNTITFDSVPGTPAYSYAGSPPGNNLFHNQGPFSAFADSVPNTPAHSNAGRDFHPPFASAFSDSVPSTPINGPEDHSFDNLSRFDSFSSSTPHDSFSRFDSFHSTTQDSEVDQGFCPPQNFTRFDSDSGHSLFQPHESFSEV